MKILQDGFSFGHYKNIIFDVGNVLLAWRPREIIEKTIKNPQQLDFYEKNIFQHKIWFDFDRGIIASEEEMIEFFVDHLKRPRAEIEDLMLLVKESLLPIPESLTFLQECSTQPLSLYALTNMPKSVFDYLKLKYSFWDHFKDIVVSGYVQMIKPEPEIYHYILKRNNLNPAETIFFDDNVDNVAAARELNIAAIQFKDVDDCLKQLQVLIKS